jgi:plasmid replication initiation protein
MKWISTMSSKNLIVKDNRLIEASYRLDAIEQRLILLAIVEARDQNITITADEWIEVTAKRYAEVCGIDISQAYKQLKSSSDSLFMRWMLLRGVDQKTGKEGVIKTRWVSACTYVDHSALVRLQLAPMIIPYITDLQTCFTSYQLKNVVQMSSRYAIRLYELLAQYKSVGARYISLADLRDYLDAHEKAYNILQNFKTKVLNVGVEQINLYTDLQVSYQPKKAGRVVIGYEFKIESKQSEQHDDASTLLPAPKSPPPQIAQGLSVGEGAMLRELQEKYPELTEKMVLKMAKDQKKDVFMIIYEVSRHGLP